MEFFLIFRRQKPGIFFKNSPEMAAVFITGSTADFIKGLVLDFQYFFSGLYSGPLQIHQRGVPGCLFKPTLKCSSTHTELFGNNIEIDFFGIMIFDPLLDDLDPFIGMIFLKLKHRIGRLRTPSHIMDQ